MKLQSTLERIVASLDVSRFPLRLNLYVRDGVILDVRMRVPDRDTGDLRVVSASRQWPALEYVDDDRLATMQVVEFLRSLVLHEFDELLTVNGERMFDPHNDAKRLCGASP